MFCLITPIICGKWLAIGAYRCILDVWRRIPNSPPAAGQSVPAAGRGALGAGSGMVCATLPPTPAGGAGKTAAAFGDRV